MIRSTNSNHDLGLAFLDKALFTTFNYTPTPSSSPSSSSSSDPLPPTFQISLSSLLETLQIFGTPETKDRWPTTSTPYPTIHPSSPSAFSTRTLGISSLCRLSYASPGSPLTIHLSESNLTTTCALSTYEPDPHSADIPLQRNALALKIIMRASWLHDAIAELASTSPTRLTLTASPTAPYFTLAATGPLGSATVEFSRDRQLLETFQVERRTCHTYKFSLVRQAEKAMAAASKVSVRGDGQGVLSLQFMVEVEGGGVSFVDFRFVPFVEEEGEGDGEGEDEGGGEEG